jgi:drug/metabolite transporter (DMT)-like permease
VSAPARPAPAETRRAYLLLVAMPLFFSSNLVLGRAAVEEVAPFTLAFLRWGLAAAILLAISRRDLRARWTQLRPLAGGVLLLGFLGMWICGAIVYLALAATTATNATLIYTTSPLFVVAMVAWRTRRVRGRELAGVALGMVGVAVIVLRADLGALLTLALNPGDVGILGCAFVWAVYSVILRQEAYRDIPTLPLFTAIALAGAATLLPFAIAESLWLGRFPTSGTAWASVLALAIFPSILAFGLYQYGVKIVGPSVTSIFMYLLPVYGVALAVAFLGEPLRAYHLAGLVLVTAGVAAATLPADLLARLGRRG